MTAKRTYRVEILQYPSGRWLEDADFTSLPDREQIDALPRLQVPGSYEIVVCAVDSGPPAGELTARVHGYLKEVTRQTAAPLEQLNLNINARAAIGLVDELTDGYLTVDLPYQRGPVWTEEQRVKLVYSWMTGAVASAIIVNDRSDWRAPGGQLPAGAAYCAVVDGKQRLLTARDWFTGALAVPSSWFYPHLVAVAEATADGPYVRYPGLTRASRLYCARTWLLPVGTAKLGTVQEEAEWYLRVNGSGTPQVPEDMARAAQVAGTDGGVI